MLIVHCRHPNHRCALQNLERLRRTQTAPNWHWKHLGCDAFVPAQSLGFFDFYGNYHNTFNGASASFAAPLNTAEEGFVDFNVAGKLITFDIDHSHSKAL